jgi:hypothetical protein
MKSIGPMYELDARQLDTALDILRKEQKANLPSRRENAFYALLNTSVYTCMLAFVTFAILNFAKTDDIAVPCTDDLVSCALDTFAIIWIVSGLLAVILFLLNFPLLSKLWRQLKFVRRLGLSEFATMLWRERQLSSRIFQLTTLILGLVAGLFIGVISILLGKPIYIVLGFFVGTTIGITGFIRQRKLQLEAMSQITGLEQTLADYKTTAEQRGVSHIELPSNEFEEIARIETARIRRQRAEAIENFDKSKDAQYVVMKSNAIRQALATLDIDTRLRVEEVIETLGREAKSNARINAPTEEVMRLRVPEENLEIVYCVEETHQRLKVLSLESAAG